MKPVSASNAEDIFSGSVTSYRSRWNQDTKSGAEL